MDDTELAEGTQFGRYRIIARLGAGAMGAVYKAVHTGLDKLVVLKVLHPRYARSPEVQARFEREGKAAAAIRHPNVVDVTDVGVHEGTPYLIMELLTGSSLGDLLKAPGPMATDAAVDLLLPVIAGVDAAHAAGVVHRDLKPDNIFVTRDATGAAHPKVLDFGISRVVSGDEAKRTGTAALLGTPSYMAPEQIESSRDSDARSDQYALGVILYECLTGQQAFRADNIYVVLRMVGDGVFAPPRALRADIPPTLEAIVLRAMARAPAARFPSLRELMAVLLPFASERARVLWGSAVRASQPALAAPVAPSPAPAKTAVAPREAANNIGDTMAVRLTAAEPTRRSGRTTGVVALVAALLVGAVIIARTTRDPAPVAASPRAADLAPAVTQVTPSPVADRAVVAAPVATVDAGAPPAIVARAEASAPSVTAHAHPTRSHAAARHASHGDARVAAQPAATPAASAQCTGPDCQHPVE